MKELKELIKDGPVTEVVTIVTRYTPGEGIQEDVAQHHVYNRELSMAEIHNLCPGYLLNDWGDDRQDAKLGEGVNIEKVRDAALLEGKVAGMEMVAELIEKLRSR